MELITEWERHGRRVGRQEGRQEGAKRGRQSIVLRQLERRLGALPKGGRRKIQALDVERLEALAEALLDFTSVDDLMQWLGDADR